MLTRLEITLDIKAQMEECAFHQATIFVSLRLSKKILSGIRNITIGRVLKEKWKYSEYLEPEICSSCGVKRSGTMLIECRTHGCVQEGISIRVPMLGNQQMLEL